MKTYFLFICALLVSLCSKAQSDTVYVHVSLDKATENVFVVQMKMPVSVPLSVMDLHMPAWTPGYYQVLDFGKNVDQFEVKDDKGKTLSWQKIGDNQWRIATDGAKQLQVCYEVKAARSFVAIPYIDQQRAFIRPTGLFLYSEKSLKQPVVVHIEGKKSSHTIATGLPLLGRNRYYASDVDILYDSPILVGELKELPPFSMGGKKHRFLGYGMVDFDEQSLMRDIEKIVKVATDMIGDIPYDAYTFIGLGPGNGGIEQLNSTAIAFTGDGLDKPSSRLRTLSFIAHEYFHHYNVKRIRPIALDPFDYSRANRTDGLWLSEGLTVYYESTILSRAGLITGKQTLEKWQTIIQGYENNPGKTKQTLAESSLNTWEDGPFGKRGETISFYEKGPIIGMLLDITIRSATSNKRSLDDLMRELYYSIYKDKQRGFTADEVQELCEKLAGRQLKEVFSYIHSTDNVDYTKYFALVGIDYKKEQKEGGTYSVTLTVNPSKTTLQQNILDAMLGKF